MAAVLSCSVRPQYLLVDGHSIIFAWPELRALHERRTSLAREALIKQLRDYQDWSGIKVVVVFDGRGPTVSHEAEPGEIQVFYSRVGQTADTIIERLASKYAERFRLVVATGDYLEQETASASGAETLSPEGLRDLLREGRSR
jgi:predicted RNA-binding protein with PIN domain